MASGQKLFKYYRDLQKEEVKSKRLFYYRLHRWRLDPTDYSRPLKAGNKGFTSLLRLKNLVPAFIVYRFTLHYIFPPHH